MADENDKAPSSSSETSPTVQEQGAQPPAAHDPSLAEELGVSNLEAPILGARGRLFSTAGPNSPIAEFTDDFLVLHPPQKPLASEGPSETIMLYMDDRGVLLNEIGEPRKVPTARYHGRELFYFWEQKPGTLRHYVVWFDDAGAHHYLIADGEKMTTEIAYRLRNMTHDGEISIFPEVTAE